MSRNHRRERTGELNSLPPGIRAGELQFLQPDSPSVCERSRVLVLFRHLFVDLVCKRRKLRLPWDGGLFRLAKGRFSLLKRLALRHELHDRLAPRLRSVQPLLHFRLRLQITMSRNVGVGI
jgi:hypothetical protein